MIGSGLLYQWGGVCQVGFWKNRVFFEIFFGILLYRICFLAESAAKAARGE